jgi:alkaline phosphatase D
MEGKRTFLPSLLVACLVIMLGVGCRARTMPAAPTSWLPTPGLTHGVAVGEVSDGSAVIWGRCERAGRLRATVRDQRSNSARSVAIEVDSTTDFTGRALLTGLEPDTTYRYQVWCGDDTAGTEVSSRLGEAEFRTAPRSSDRRRVRFAWGGDVGGQNVCRDAREGYPILARVAQQAPDFFVALGDFIYADDPCRTNGRYRNSQVPGPFAPALDLEAFRAVWKYNRADPSLQRLLATTSVYSVWDDHEIKNDAGPLHDTLPAAPDRHLLPIALQAFLEYQPLLPPPVEPTRLYRSVRWGKHLELFILDTRQYRDANDRADTDEFPKTMLGDKQRAWLLGALVRSDATWKVMVSSVPMSIPTGNDGRDGWADFEGPTGFEQELISILRYLHRSGVHNHVWITTDVHFASVLRYLPFPEDESFTVHEFVTGPLHAGVFPRSEFDTTLAPERLFFHGPANASAIRSLAEAKRWFNFGVMEVDEKGTLTSRIVDGNGGVVYELTLQPRDR